MKTQNLPYFTLNIGLNHKYSHGVIKLNIIQDNHVNIIRSF